MSEREREKQRDRRELKSEEACNKSQLVFRLPWEQRVIRGLVCKTDRLFLFCFLLVYEVWIPSRVPLSCMCWVCMRVFVCQKAWEWFNHKEAAERARETEEHWNATPPPPSLSSLSLYLWETMEKAICHECNHFSIERLLKQASSHLSNL